MKNNKILPKVTIELDCIPKSTSELKNNIYQLYNVCNEVIKNPKCFYTNEEVQKLKNSKKFQEQSNVEFL